MSENRVYKKSGKHGESDCTSMKMTLNGRIGRQIAEISAEISLFGKLLPRGKP
jgi:hypothetical protein